MGCLWRDQIEGYCFSGTPRTNMDCLREEPYPCPVAEAAIATERAHVSATIRVNSAPIAAAVSGQYQVSSSSNHVPDWSPIENEQNPAELFTFWNLVSPDYSSLEVSRNPPGAQANN